MDPAKQNRRGNIGWVICAEPSKPNASAEAQLIKYHPSRYFGELEAYLNEGWVDEGENLTYKNQKIPKQWFQERESSYVLAWLRLFPGVESTQLEGLDDRLLYIDEQDKLDFFVAYGHADHYLQSQSLKI